MNESEDYRIIRTGLYSEAAAKIFKEFFAYAYNNAHKRKERKIFERVKVLIAPDGEVQLKAFYAYTSCLRPDAKYREYYNGHTIWDKHKHEDTPLKRWLASAIKHHVISYFDGDAEWKRDGHAQVECFASKSENGEADFIPDVADVFFVCDFIRGCKNVGKTFEKEVAKKIIGQRRDPMLTEMEMNRRAKIAQLEEEFMAKKKTLTYICDQDKKKLEEKRDLDIQIAREAKDKAIAEINETVEKVLKMHQSV